MKEYESIKCLAKKYELHPSQIFQWRTQALNNFGAVFGTNSNKQDSSKEKDAPYKPEFD